MHDKKYVRNIDDFWQLKLKLFMFGNLRSAVGFEIALVNNTGRTFKTAYSLKSLQGALEGEVILQDEDERSLTTEAIESDLTNLSNLFGQAGFECISISCSDTEMVQRCFTHKSLKATSHLLSLADRALKEGGYKFEREKPLSAVDQIIMENAQSHIVEKRAEEDDILAEAAAIGTERLGENDEHLAEFVRRYVEEFKNGSKVR